MLGWLGKLRCPAGWLCVPGGSWLGSSARSGGGGGSLVSKQLQNENSTATSSLYHATVRIISLLKYVLTSAPF